MYICNECLGTGEPTCTSTMKVEISKAQVYLHIRNELLLALWIKVFFLKSKVPDKRLIIVPIVHMITYSVSRIVPREPVAHISLATNSRLPLLYIATSPHVPGEFHYW